MMNENHLVSVVIPLYNAEKYIGVTLESVVNQTYKNIEIVVVDDGSKDRSSTIVLEFQEKYPEMIKYVYQQNQGVSVARNTGIYQAKGTYIAFLDSDDYWDQTKVEKQMKSISENKMDACYCGYINFMDETAEETKQEVKFIKGDLTKAFLTHQVLAQTSTWIIKKNILVRNNITFTPGVNWGEDLEFFFKVMSVTNVCYVDEYLTYYRILSTGNLSSKFRNYNLKTEKELEVYQRIRNWIIENKHRLISPNSSNLLRIIDTYIKPHIIIDNACIYFRMNDDIEKKICLQIKDDLSRYVQKIYYQNGRKSIKLVMKLMYVHMQIKKYIK
ncbi:beta-1,3-N-acetylglucosaminyltransferase [Bacillus sp. V3-13]|uniref:glycosyltransferase family 2 protein n=1 Tax=Bacillus sp. V3-13 TaxID=2053728 RepID=UPI000C75EC8C|nr:glycosyltransferase family A protein [Bacillus sp. V3-13]PLR75937.1 beta-1,3-N-acetylglucosaminyltransferase [Bacillus sp. V3-13]